MFRFNKVNTTPGTNPNAAANNGGGSPNKRKMGNENGAAQQNQQSNQINTKKFRNDVNKSTFENIIR